MARASLARRQVAGNYPVGRRAPAEENGLRHVTSWQRRMLRAWRHDCSVRRRWQRHTASPTTPNKAAEEMLHCMFQENAWQRCRTPRQINPVRRNADPPTGPRPTTAARPPARLIRSPVRAICRAQSPARRAAAHADGANRYVRVATLRR